MPDQVRWEQPACDRQDLGNREWVMGYGASVPLPAAVPVHLLPTPHSLFPITQPHGS